MGAWIDSLLPTDVLAPPLKQPLDLPELRAWAMRFANAAQARMSCTRGDWLLWLARRTAVNESEVRRTVAAAAACARWLSNSVLEIDMRSLRALELAERWATSGDDISLVLQDAAAQSLAASSRFDPDVRPIEFALCVAVSAACRLADPMCADDARALVLLVDSCFPVSAYADAKAHAASDPFYGKVPNDALEKNYRRLRTAARREAVDALNAIVRSTIA